jgi:hypothetical protein
MHELRLRILGEGLGGTFDRLPGIDCFATESNPFVSGDAEVAKVHVHREEVHKSTEDEGVKDHRDVDVEICLSGESLLLNRKPGG